MLTLFENRIIVFAPFVLPQKNWPFDSGKTNGVMPAHVIRHWGKYGDEIFTVDGCNAFLLF